MYRLVTLVALFAASPALAAPRHASPIAQRAARAKSALDAAKTEAKVSGHVAKLEKARIAARKALVRFYKLAWVDECVYERTGPDGGIPVLEAFKLCEAECPDDPEALLNDPDMPSPVAPRDIAVERHGKRGGIPQQNR